jgi:hypothetical protein
MTKTPVMNSKNERKTLVGSIEAIGRITAAWSALLSVVTCAVANSQIRHRNGATLT